MLAAPRLFPTAPIVSLSIALAFAFAPSVASAQDVTEIVRSDFPDRRWMPVTAADAGLAGSGLATDPASSAYGNPALWLTAPWSFRVSGGMMNPNRDDLRATTTDFQEANGFPFIGEVAVRFKTKGLGFGAYFSQPHYEHGETRFVGFNASTGGGGDPFPRTNTFTSATRYGGAGGAFRLQGGMVIGAGAEGVFTQETYESIPDVPPGSGIADTARTDVDGSSVGGVLGVLVPFGSAWSVGASYRFAGELSYGDAGGYDDAPMLGLIGLRYGQTAGSAGYAGFRWLGERKVNLGDPFASTDQVADTRLEYALGYAYLDPAGTWTVRIGGALSPAPSDDANRLTRFGVSLGLGGDGLRGALAYSRESETRPDDRNSSRNLVIATVELGR